MLTDELPSDERAKRSRRVGIYYIPEERLLSILRGEMEIAGLPNDAKMDAVYHDFSRGAFGVRIASETFQEVEPGNIIPKVGAGNPFTYRIEAIGDRTIAVAENAERIERTDGSVKFREFF